MQVVQDVQEAVQVVGQVGPDASRVLTPEALAFVAELHRTFNPTREVLLQRRAERQAAIDAGQPLDFLAETSMIRKAEWQVASAPPDIQDRRVEITGPVERKMMINALNSGAKVFMADFEDALSPTWENIVQGQINLMDAVRRKIEYISPDGKVYRLNDKTATLFVRPRGWHLVENHVLVNGKPISASIFDFGIYFFHNAHELLKGGSGPYFYLPKLESHLEARLWKNIFNLAQYMLGIPQGTIRATVLIETILAAFEMEEILYELRFHSAGLNAGRWDYIFSAIKKFRNRPGVILPDRAQITMTVPFMRAYTDLLVKTCHKRGAHAIGGMSAFIPSRKDPKINEVAFKRVCEDKERESGDGFDGTWVAHPDLVPVAGEPFDRVLGKRGHQRERLREDVQVCAAELVNIHVPGGQITEDGLRANVSVALQYIESWLRGNGAAAINNLMEDVATAEISRAQLWQWVHHGATLDDRRTITARLYETIRNQELAKLSGLHAGRYQQAAKILDQLVLSDKFCEFLTLVAYEYLD
jgi:malate synthase